MEDDSMANEEQLAILRQGVEVWNKWRKENPNIEIELTSANLSDLNLSEIDFIRANISGVNFSGTDLTGADLMDTKVWNANLDNASLSGAIIFGADFIGTSFVNTDFTGAILGVTVFGDIDLSQTKGLEEVQHLTPSIISGDTIQKSKGKIPEIFLRGCGLSDIDIEYAKLAKPGLDPEQVTDITYRIHQLYVGQGINYYSCFISYNNKDEDFTKHLHDDLQDNGVRCWFAPEDMKIGDQIRPRIDQEIRLRDKLLVILSENAVRSEWVGDEVEAALEEESKSNRLVLFPIRLDDTVMSTRDDWAAKIKRRRHIGDFSNWKDKASYQKAFERLLRDLKATGGGVNGE